MMTDGLTNEVYETIRRFFANLGAGTLEPEMFAPHWTAWTVSIRQTVSGSQYLAATQMLAGLFGGTLRYQVQSLLAEGDLAAAQVHGSGTLLNGETYENDYAHVFTLREGKIAHVAEFFDPGPVGEKIMPLLTAALDARRSAEPHIEGA